MFVLVLARCLIRINKPASSSLFLHPRHDGSGIACIPTTSHGSGLGKTRWVVERTIAWLHSFRRLKIRYERHAIHEAFLSLACSLICWSRLKHYMNCFETDSKLFFLSAPQRGLPAHGGHGRTVTRVTAGAVGVRSAEAYAPPTDPGPDWQPSA